MKTLKILLLSLTLTLATLTARPAPDQSLLSQGWYCIYVPANNSPTADWQTYEAVDWWVELCYGGVYTIWREGDADGWYWYLRLGTTTAR